MKRTALLARSGFRRPVWTPEPRSPLVLVDRPSQARPGPSARTQEFNPRPKDNVCRSEAYRRIVAGWACIHCNRPGPSQSAHADQGRHGKGKGIKSDDRTVYPACADRPGRQGCHSLIGASGMFTRAMREKLEDEYAARTRARVLAEGLWPADLPMWPVTS